MGMNELAERLIAFDEALSRFQEVLRGALVDQEEARQKVAGQWDDEFAKEFTARYDAINDPVLAVARDIDGRLKPDVEGRVAAALRYLQ